jgi:hypothetical protein
MKPTGVCGALFFDQVKAAWLLRKVAPNSPMGYLVIWKLWPLWPILVLAIFSIGCAHRIQPSKFRGIESIQFRDCEITDRRDGKTVCECGKIEWIRDVQFGRWIAVCLK